MVKITAGKHVKKLNLGSNLTSNKIYFQVLHYIGMNVALSFIFNFPLIAYFLKKNYSLRQNIFEKFKGLREVTHISLNWCLFGSY